MVKATRKSSFGVSTPAVWDLRLYVAGKNLRSTLALENLKNVCEEHLSGRYRIEVVDLRKHPELARAEQIVAIPTLVRKNPKPVRTGIGNLTDARRLLDLLNRN